jgi:hypothetical protein
MKKMNEGMKALKKEAPGVAKKMGYMYGGMSSGKKKDMGMMDGGMSSKKKMGYSVGGMANCGASMKAERPMKKSK